MTGKCIICIPFAHRKNANTGVNINAKSSVQTYLKNACVALCSAKYHNPECEVALVTNLMQDEVPFEYRNLLEKANISILHVPYSEFLFPDKYLWSLAFYKLCVLKYLTTTDYEAVCYMDTDVYIQGSFENIWEECKEHILLYDVNHGLGTKDYQMLCDEMKAFTGKKIFPTHYGGEFFAASLELANVFYKECENVYKRMIKTSFVTTKGDEFILSLAAYSLRNMVKNSGAYVFRFWTSASFRYVSTCYKHNRIVVLHVPSEKEKGIVSIYNKYVSRGKIPDDKSCWRLLRLTRITIDDRIRYIAKKILMEIGVCKE